MTRFFNTHDGGTADTAITVANSGGASGTAFSAIGGTGSPTYKAAAAMHGALGWQTGATAAAEYFTSDVTAAAGVAARVYFRLDALPGTDFHLLRFMNGSTRLVSWHVNAANKLRLSDASGTSGVWTAANALLANTWYRLELYAKPGTTSSNGVIKGAYYLGDSTTPVETIYSSTTANVGTSTTIDKIQRGKITATATAAKFDSHAWDDNASDLIGPFSNPLDTPEPVVTGYVNPTTIAGTDGTATVTWAAVSGAVRYDAMIAHTAEPLQGDFTLKQTGVTSPYTFTGLGAGTHALGIIARSA
ncbi:hypothetical protein [Microbacterium sp.]|uniref:hypothetical protein n=1 Tax=Microbacterium sp. TaxID=51671 RepID=UPI0039E4E3DC